MSQIISFMRSDPQKRTLFFFCDYCTPAHDVPAQIFKAYLVQSIRRESNLAPFIYDNYSSKGRSPTTKMLKEILVTILKESDFVRLIVDGVDEVQSTEHRRVLQELHAVTVAAGTSCKLLVSSQDLPTIRPFLSGRSRDHLFLGDEKQAISQDMAIVVDVSLESLGEVLGVTLDMSERMSLRKRVLEKAEGRDLIPFIILIIVGLTNALLFRHVPMAETSLESPRNSGELGGAEVNCRQLTTRSGRDVSSLSPEFWPTRACSMSKC